MDFDNLHQLLKSLYSEMMPLCDELAGVAKGIAGLGALFYISYRIWKSLAQAEPIDVFPLLRPFVIGTCILFFQVLILSPVNGILSPIVQGCHRMLEKQQTDVTQTKAERDRLEKQAMLRDPSQSYLIDNEEFDKKMKELGMLDVCEKTGMYMDRAMFNAKKAVQDWFNSLLELIFNGVALVIDVIRTFFLIVLAIMGPIAFAVSIWDGFQNTLVQWFCRYISIYLWLPISDIFSTIMARLHLLILNNDIKLFQDPSYIPDSSNGIYIIFMLIGIMGYFTIPTVASWVIESGGGGNYSRAINTVGTKLAAFGGGLAGSAAGAITSGLPGMIKGGYNGMRSFFGSSGNDGSDNDNE